MSLSINSKICSGGDEALLALLLRNVQSMSSKDSEKFGSSKVNTLAAAAFLEVLYSVKYAIFRVKEGLYTLIASNILFFISSLVKWRD